MYSRYRNKGARHKHELETKNTLSNLRRDDSYVTRRTGLSNSRMIGANNTMVNGSNKNSVINMINQNINK